MSRLEIWLKVLWWQSDTLWWHRSREINNWKCAMNNLTQCFNCFENRNFSTYYPSLGLALIRTIKIGTENFRNDEISWNFKIFKCISHYFIFVPISCLEPIRNIKFISYDHSKIMWFRNKFQNHKIFWEPKSHFRLAKT